MAATAAVFLVVLVGCSTLTKRDYDRLAAIPGEIKAIYDTAQKLVEQATDIVKASGERELTPEEKLIVGDIYGEVVRLFNQGQALTKELAEIRARAAEGAFDWNALLAMVGSILGATGIVRLQRGPAKPTDPYTAAAIRHLSAEEIARLRRLADSSSA